MAKISLVLSNQYNLEFHPKPLKENELEKCNLTLDDYITNSQWVGSGNANCSSPKILRNQVSATIEDLSIEKFRIQTFDQNFYVIYPNDSSLSWTKLHEDFLLVCFTMKLPEEILDLGIRTINVDTNNGPHLIVYVHLEGLLSTDLPDSYPEVYHTGYGYSIPVAHEIVQLQRYDGEICNSNVNYKLDKCRMEYVQKVRKY